MKRFLPLIALLSVMPRLFSQTPLQIQLQEYASGFSNPLDIVHCGDSRLFIVEQGGLIWILDSTGKKLPEPFINIDPRVNSSGNEQGLLGLAFHPNYAQNGFFYLSYTKSDGGSRLSRFSVNPADPNKANAGSEVILLEVAQPFANHNGGCIRFGPDGMLYFALGDGGSGGDPQDNGQKKGTLLGKMLRLDVSSNVNKYTVPVDNPFINDPAYRPEIWSLGWRNPWRFSFDRVTGDLWAGDVGQGAREEIDFEPAYTGGRNYGWRCYEGSGTYNTSGCQGASAYTKPVFDYPNPTKGCSVTGGYVYRGRKNPDLYGRYIFTDYCSGRWWAIRQNANGAFTGEELNKLSNFDYSSLGEDRDGELYVAGLATGKIYRLVEKCASFQLSSKVIQPACNNNATGSIQLQISGGLSPLAVWSTGFTGTNLNNLAEGVYTVNVTENGGCSRRDTFRIKAVQNTSPDIRIVEGQNILCANDTVVLQIADPPVIPAGGSVIFQWFKNGSPIPSSNKNQLKVTAIGDYRARWVTQPAGCASLLSDTISIENEIVIQPEIFFVNDSVLAVVGPSANSAFWLLNGNPLPGGFGSSYVPKKSGFYECVLTSEAGCVYRPGIQVVITDTRTPSDVLQFSLSPNPAHTQAIVRMRLRKEQTATLQLIDNQLKTVYRQNIRGTEIQAGIQLEHLPAGAYYLSVQTESGSFVRQIIKR